MTAPGLGGCRSPDQGSSGFLVTLLLAALVMIGTSAQFIRWTSALTSAVAPPASQEFQARESCGASSATLWVCAEVSGKVSAGDDGVNASAEGSVEAGVQTAGDESELDEKEEAITPLSAVVGPAPSAMGMEQAEPPEPTTDMTEQGRSDDEDDG